MREIFLVLAMMAMSVTAQEKQEKKEEAPSNEKAQKTYREAIDYLSRRMTVQAIESFKKADKQDEGHCLGCQKQIILHGMEFGEWKAVEQAAEEMLAEAQGPKETALEHYQLGIVLLNEGMNRHDREDVLSRAHQEIKMALEAVPNFPAAVLADGKILAHLKQDDAAKARFQQFLDMKPNAGPERERVLRYIAQPELARARTVPPFVVTTLDGRRISLDELQGKVVLIDFWATWCGPCRAALPHMKEIVKKFQGQPLVVISISVDNDPGKWKEFVAKNEMTWPQYFDGGFEGSVARAFDVHAIPHTFTVDADGVLQDENVGDAALEGKLKKLVKRALELQAAPPSSSVSVVRPRIRRVHVPPGRFTCPPLRHIAKI
jgi:thiol-disulfide isomerase/thioredoxin